MKFEFDPDEVAVEIKPHLGEASSRAGTFTVRLPQDIIFLNGVQVGYVGTDPGSKINLIVSDLPKEILPILKSKIDALREDASSGIAQATSLEENNVVVTDAESENSLADEDI